MALSFRLVRLGAFAAILVIVLSVAVLLTPAPAAAETAANAAGRYDTLILRDLGGKQAALVQLIAKDLPAAHQALQDALRIQPDSLDTQMMLGNVEIQSGRHHEAQRIARQLQKQWPDAAAGFILEGDAALGRKDSAAALAAPSGQ